MKKRTPFIWMFILVLIVLFAQFRLELNAKQEEESVGLNMEWLQYTPEPVKKYFKEREREGGLHTFQYEGKTYLGAVNKFV